MEGTAGCSSEAVAGCLGDCGTLRGGGGGGGGGGQACTSCLLAAAYVGEGASPSSSSLLTLLLPVGPWLRCREDTGDSWRGSCFNSRLLAHALVGGGGGGGLAAGVAAAAASAASTWVAAASAAASAASGQSGGITGCSTAEPPGTMVTGRSCVLVGCSTSSSSATALSRRCRLVAATQACSEGSPCDAGCAPLRLPAASRTWQKGRVREEGTEAEAEGGAQQRHPACRAVRRHGASGRICAKLPQSAVAPSGVHSRTSTLAPDAF